jgi:hypothetical protein
MVIVWFSHKKSFALYSIENLTSNHTSCKSHVIKQTLKRTNDSNEHDMSITCISNPMNQIEDPPPRLGRVWDHCNREGKRWAYRGSNRRSPVLPAVWCTRLQSSDRGQRFRMEKKRNTSIK